MLFGPNFKPNQGKINTDPKAALSNQVVHVVTSMPAESLKSPQLTEIGCKEAFIGLFLCKLEKFLVATF